MRKVIIAAVVAISVSGCTTVHKDWAATGGSKSDGTVKLSYQFGMFQNPEVNEQQAIDLAARRCKAWGYSAAEAFGASTKACNNQTSNGCNSWLVTKEYQCTGEQ